MRLGFFDGFDQLFDDVRCRGHVGIAHTKINNIDAFGPQTRLETIDLFEDIGGKAPYPVKITHRTDPI